MNEDLSQLSDEELMAIANGDAQPGTQQQQAQTSPVANAPEDELAAMQRENPELNAESTPIDPVKEGFRTFFGSFFGQGRKDAMADYRAQTRTGDGVDKTLGYLSDLGNSFYAGIVGGGTKLAEAAGHVFNNEKLVQGARDFQAGAEEYLPTDMVDTAEVDENGNPSERTWGQRVLGEGKNVMRMMGEFAPAAATGPVGAVVGKAYTWANIGASGVNRYNHIYDNVIANAEANHMQPSQARLLGAAGGAIDAFANAFLMGKVTKGGANPITDRFFQTFVKRMIGGAAKTGGVMGASAGAQSVIDQMAQKGDFDVEATGNAVVDGVIQGAMFHVMNDAMHAPIHWSQYKTVDAAKRLQGEREAANAEQTMTEGQVAAEAEARAREMDTARAEQRAIDAQRAVLSDPQGIAAFARNNPDLVVDLISARRRGDDAPMDGLLDTGVNGIGDLRMAFQSQKDANNFADRLIDYVDNQNAAARLREAKAQGELVEEGNTLEDRQKGWDEKAAAENEDAKAEEREARLKAADEFIGGGERQKEMYDAWLNARGLEDSPDLRMTFHAEEMGSSPRSEAPAEVRGEETRQANQDAQRVENMDDANRADRLIEADGGETYRAWCAWLKTEDSEGNRIQFLRFMNGQSYAVDSVEGNVRHGRTGNGKAEAEEFNRFYDAFTGTKPMDGTSVKPDKSEPEPQRRIGVEEQQSLLDGIDIDGIEYATKGALPEPTVQSRARNAVDAWRKKTGVMGYPEYLRGKIDDASMREMYRLYLQKKVSDAAKGGDDEAKAFTAPDLKDYVQGEFDFTYDAPKEAPKAEQDKVEPQKTEQPKTVESEAKQEPVPVDAKAETPAEQAKEEVDPRVQLREKLKGDAVLKRLDAAYRKAKTDAERSAIKDKFNERVAELRDGTAQDAEKRPSEASAQKTVDEPSDGEKERKTAETKPFVDDDGEPIAFRIEGDNGIDVYPSEIKSESDAQLSNGETVKVVEIEGGYFHIVKDGKSIGSGTSKEGAIKDLSSTYKQDSNPMADKGFIAWLGGTKLADKEVQQSYDLYRREVARGKVDPNTGKRVEAKKPEAKKTEPKPVEPVVEEAKTPAEAKAEEKKAEPSADIKELGKKAIAAQRVLKSYAGSDDATLQKYIKQWRTRGGERGAKMAAAAEDLMAYRKATRGDAQKQFVEVKMSENKLQRTGKPKDGIVNGTDVKMKDGVAEINGVNVRFTWDGSHGYEFQMNGSADWHSGFSDLTDAVKYAKKKTPEHAKRMAMPEDVRKAYDNLSDYGNVKNMDSKALRYLAKGLRDNGFDAESEYAEKLAKFFEKNPNGGNGIRESRTVGEVAKENEETLTRIGERLTSLVPGTKVRIGDTASGNAEFDTKTGEAVIPRDKPFVDAVHEIGAHGMFRWAKANAPAHFRRMLEYVRTAPKDVRDFVYDNYRDFAEKGDYEGLVDEIFAHRFERENGEGFRRLLEDKPANRHWWTNVTHAMRRVFTDAAKRNGVDLSGLNGLDAETYMKRVAEQMALGKTLNEYTAFGDDVKYLKAIPQGVRESRRVEDVKKDDYEYGEALRRGEADHPDMRYRRIDDKEEIARLNNGKTVKMLASVQDMDGALRSPMAAKIGGKMADAFEIGEWYKSDEHPELATKDGKFKLNKGDGSSDVKAAYNPYWHSTSSPLNDQFSTAYKRPELRTVEVEIPVADIESGYHAENAKNPVGEHDWKGGPLSNQLKKYGIPQRKLMLSTTRRILRVLDTREVADRIEEFLDGRKVTIPVQCMTPDLRAEMMRRGYRIGPPKGVNADQVNELKRHISDETLKRLYSGEIVDNDGNPMDGSFDSLIHRVDELPPHLRWDVDKDGVRESRRGVPYKGTKSEDAKEILDVVSRIAPNARRFVDGMMGGGSMIEEARRSGRFGKVAGRDNPRRNGVERMYVQNRYANNDGVREARRPANPMPAHAAPFMDAKETKLDKYRKNISDRYDPIKSLVMDVDMAGGKSKAEARAYAENDAASPYHAKRVQNGLVEKDMAVIGGLRRQLEKFLKDSRSDGIDVDDFGRYIYAMHAKDRNAQKLKDHGIADGSGMSDADADAIIDGFRRSGKLAKLEAARKAFVVELNDKFGLDYLRKAGLIDQQSVDRLKSAYGKDYVPLKDDITDEDGVDYGRAASVANPLLKASGRGTEAENPTAFMLLGAMRNVTNAAENIARESMAKFVEAHPDVGEVRLVKPTDRLGDDAITFRRNEMVDVVDNGKVIGREEVNRRYVVELYGNRGKRVQRSFTDADLVRGPEWMQNTTRWFASWATQLSPTFSFRNWAKDTMEVTFDTLGISGAGAAGRFLKGQFAMLPLWNADFRNVMREFRETGKVTGTSQIAQDFRKFVESGALIGGGGAREGYGEVTEDLRDIGKTLSRTRETGKRIGAMWEAYKDKVGVMNESIEMLTRFNNFRRRIADGESVEQAAMNAREGSTDFGMYGNQRWMNSVWMFSNSILGGTLRGAKTMAFGKYGRRLAAGMVALGMMEEMADLALNGDEQDERRNGTGTGDDVTEFERENGLRIRFGGQYVRIPIHLGPWSLLKYAGSNLARVMQGRLSAEDAVKNVAASAATVATHFTGTGEKGFGEGSPSLVNSMTPSAVQPFVQVAMNENYKGDQIYTEHTMPGSKDRPDWKYARRNTNRIAVQLSRIINNIPFTGGNDNRKGALDVPPETLEYLTKQVFKNFGTDVVNTLVEVPSRAVQAAMGDADAMELRTTPVVHDFVRKTPDVSSRYYKEMQAYEGDLREYKDMPADGRAAFAKAHYGMHGQLKELKKRIDNAVHGERGERKSGNTWVTAPNMSESAKKLHGEMKLKLMAKFLRLREAAAAR